MRYLLLLRSDRSAWEDLGEEGQQALYRAYTDYHRWIGERGYLVEASPVAGDAVTTVRRRQGAQTSTDGPFAETKEHMVGFYLLDCPDLDAAIESAGRCPDAALGSVEIFPLAAVPSATDHASDDRTE